MTNVEKVGEIIRNNMTIGGVEPDVFTGYAEAAAEIMSEIRKVGDFYLEQLENSSEIMNNRLSGQISGVKELLRRLSI